MYLVKKSSIRSLEKLFSWKRNFTLALPVTSGLLLTSQKAAMSTEITETLNKESLVVTFSRNRLPIRFIPQFTVAQIPNPIPPRTPQLPLETPQPTLPPPVELDPSETPSPEILTSPETITVKKFEFKGNTAFSNAELSQTVKEFTNRPISFAELLQAEEKIRDKYTAGCRGDSQQPCYLNSGAFIPPNSTFPPRSTKI